MSRKTLSKWALLGLCGGATLFGVGSCVMNTLETLAPVIVTGVIGSVIGAA